MRLLFVLILFWIGIGVASAQSLAPGTQWENQRGSILTVDQLASDGTFTGTYVNKAAGFSCQNEIMAVRGITAASLVTFWVRWKNANVDCQSITTWVGSVSGDTLRTEWNLVYVNFAGNAAYARGSDDFSRK